MTDEKLLQIRRLTENGIEEFQKYVNSEPLGNPPFHLLSDDAFSEEIPWAATIENKLFSDRFEFGSYLVNALSSCDRQELSDDNGIWSWLALFFFDQLCPADGNVKRSPKKNYHYILSLNFWHRFRHLVRVPYVLVRDNGENARVLLLKSLNVHGELIEQIGNRQEVVGCPAVMKAIDILYYDKDNDAPKKGVASKGPGSSRRIADIFKQFSQTYDLHAMSGEAIVSILPDEFQRWVPA